MLSRAQIASIVPSHGRHGNRTYILRFVCCCVFSSFIWPYYCVGVDVNECVCSECECVSKCVSLTSWSVLVNPWTDINMKLSLAHCPFLLFHFLCTFYVLTVVTVVPTSVFRMFVCYHLTKWLFRLLCLYTECEPMKGGETCMKLHPRGFWQLTKCESDATTFSFSRSQAS